MPYPPRSQIVPPSTRSLAPMMPGYASDSTLKPENMRNETQTVPGVYGTPLPGFWGSNEAWLQFATAAELPALYAATYAQPIVTGAEASPAPQSRAIWSSPIFDTMPGLRGSSGPVNGAPLWVPGTSLAVMIYGHDTIANSSMFQVGYIENGSPLNPDKSQPLTLKTDITPSFWSVPGKGNAVILTWTPPPSVRFWGLTLVFDNYSATKPTGLRIQAAAAQAG